LLFKEIKSGELPPTAFWKNQKVRQIAELQILIIISSFLFKVDDRIIKSSGYIIGRVSKKFPAFFIFYLKIIFHHNVFVKLYESRRNKNSAFSVPSA
jgi:hypothetical protein